MQSVHENRIYSLKMHCGDQYPDKSPTIQFISQVNLPCVSPRNGVVSICGNRGGVVELADSVVAIG